MGIKGFLTYLKSIPGAVQAVDLDGSGERGSGIPDVSSFDHVYVDMNSLLHQVWPRMEI